MPPSLSGTPPMGAGAMSVPSGSPGKNANALAQVREALKILEKALPELPMGSEPHQAILKAITNLGKHVPPSNEVPGVQQTALRDIAAGSGKNAMMDQVMKSLGSPQGGAGGGAPGTAMPGAPAAPPGM